MPSGRGVQSETDKKEGEKVSYYRVCQKCGAHIDPGERCDCTGETTAEPTGAAVELGRIVPSERAIIKPPTPPRPRRETALGLNPPALLS